MATARKLFSDLSDFTGFRHIHWGCFDCLCQVPDVSDKGLGSSGEHSVCWLPGQLLTVVRNQPLHDLCIFCQICWQYYTC